MANHSSADGQISSLSDVYPISDKDPDRVNPVFQDSRWFKMVHWLLQRTSYIKSGEAKAKLRDPEFVLFSWEPSPNSSNTAIPLILLLAPVLNTTAMLRVTCRGGQTIQECKGWRLTLGGEGWEDCGEGYSGDFLGTRSMMGRYRGVHLPFLFKPCACLMHCPKWMIHAPLTQTQSGIPLRKYATTHSLTSCYTSLSLFPSNSLSCPFWLWWALGKTEEYH